MLVLSHHETVVNATASLLCVSASVSSIGQKWTPSSMATSLWHLQASRTLPISRSERSSCRVYVIYSESFCNVFILKYWYLASLAWVALGRCSPPSPGCWGIVLLGPHSTLYLLP